MLRLSLSLTVNERQECAFEVATPQTDVMILSFWSAQIFQKLQVLASFHLISNIYAQTPPNFHAVYDYFWSILHVIWDFFLPFLIERKQTHFCVLLNMSVEPVFPATLWTVFEPQSMRRWPIQVSPLLNKGQKQPGTGRKSLSFYIRLCRNFTRKK